MPELPEVETICRGLQQLIVGRRILGVKVFNERSFQADPAETETYLIGAKVARVHRRAKVLIIDLSTDYSLVIHLKMTGQLVFRDEEKPDATFRDDSSAVTLPGRSTRVEFDFNDNTKLFFNDQRKFGWVKLLPTVEVETLDFLRKVGPEPLTGDPKLPAQFLKNIRHHNATTIKAALLNQTVIAGIGNIYADESLWSAKVHPASRVRDLSDAKLKKILQAVIDVMNKSLASGGSTMKDYVRADGTKGSYLEKFAQVFNREGQPCSRCGTTIEKIRVAGRGTHICPKCQKFVVDAKPQS